MSKRLQVVMDEDELDALREIADRRGMTVSEWVRRAIHEARRAEAASDPARKLAVVRAASVHTFPVGEIDEMLDEVQRGYLTGGPE
jgi:hypothetical protein